MICVVVGYLFVCLVVLSTGVYFLAMDDFLLLGVTGKVIGRCVIMGGLGGVVYCMRGVYLNYSVRNNWNDRWMPWYLLRPWVSFILGGVSFVFLKAGLLALNSRFDETSEYWTFYALAFVAGYNVDKFLKRLEEINESVFGINKSRASPEESKSDEN